MPAKNIVKNYFENGYYHVYNRGVEKRTIFEDDQDCIVFLHYLKMYLTPQDELQHTVLPGNRINRFIPLNLEKEVDLIAFTLMPNHIHLLLKQYSQNGITKLMRRIITAYVMYFNKKYKRVGALFQNIYKACHVTNDNYILHLSRYIHLNPHDISSNINFIEYSSYPYYLGKKQASWIKPTEVLNHFNNNKTPFSYQEFVENFTKNSKDILGDLTLEND